MRHGDHELDAFPVLAPAISADTGWSVALLTAGVLGVPDRRGADRCGRMGYGRLSRITTANSRMVAVIAAGAATTGLLAACPDHPQWSDGDHFAGREGDGRRVDTRLPQ
ncbi:hypothetical protein AB0L13_15840 [Saccharopolyspora shandongensis]|uniref:hypothetical protein n=1 Tax=Saccharopolyspora shandongensis TaxID=418495 RepID=UPI003416AF0C